MKRRRTAWLLSLCLGIAALLGGAAPAGAAEEEGFQGENPQTLEQATGIDENGNVYVIPEDQETEPIGRSPLAREEGGELVNFRTKDVSEITEYLDVPSGGNGYTNGHYGADGAYLGMADGKVKFMLSGSIGLVDAAEVTIVSLEEAQSISHYEVEDGRLIHRVTTDMSKTFEESYGSYLDNGNAPSYLQAGTEYYSYDGHYFYTYENFQNMLADYQAGTREHAVNPEDPYFNYFQFLPLRSQTTYSDTELNEMLNSRVEEGSKLEDAGQWMVVDQNRYGVNALLVAGIAANESGWGTSNISQKKNNIFGIAAADSNPGELSYAFDSVRACIREYMEDFLSQQYLNPDNWKYEGGFLGNKACGKNFRYSSDPYWGEKAAALAWSLDRAAGSRDAGLYTIGIKDILPDAEQEYADLKVRTGASTSTDIVYSTGLHACYAFLIRNETPVDGFYQVQSDPVLNSDRTAIGEGGNYDFQNMYLYASADYIQIVSHGAGAWPEIPAVSFQLPFTDVQQGDWFCNSVEYIYDQSIMTGLTPDTFGPYETCSRAQLAVMLYRMEGEPAVEYKDIFPDVPDDDELFFVDAVMWAQQNGVITGYTEGATAGLFGPEDEITREQVATILYRYAKYKKYDLTVSEDWNSYPDSGKVSGFAQEGMAWAVAQGILTGKTDTGTLEPLQNIARAEMATMFTRFAEKF